MREILINANVITDGSVLRGIDIVTENGKITDVLKNDGSREGKDYSDSYVAPGFIDIHCHGGDNCEFSFGDEESIKWAAQIHFDHGTRVLYPTLSANSFENYYKILEVMEKVAHELPVEIPGVHLEGPFLNPEMCGAQNSEYIFAPRKDKYEPLVERFGKLIKRWSYAPEFDKKGEFLEFLLKHDIVPAIAHSAAEYGDVLAAYGSGNRLVTHLYSCTSTITRHSGFRRLGIIETAYLLDDMFVEAIGDGRHLPPELFRLIVKQKGKERVVLVTDAIAPAGHFEDGTTGLSSGVAYIVEDGVAKLIDKSAFAGSIATTDVLLKRSIEAGISLADSVYMLTQSPANAMGLTNKGRIAPGYDAQFTIFNMSEVN